jgi:hypothetical protein
MAVAAEGSLPRFGASAIVGGGGAAVSTPTSSQLLGQVSPPRLAPLVFSIKQTAVPAVYHFGHMVLAGIRRCYNLHNATPRIS